MTGTPAQSPGVAVFDYQVWAARYPNIAVNVTEVLAQSYFDEAGLYLNNTPRSIVRDLGRRSLLLGMIAAHLALLNLPTSQGGAGGAVGRVASATRGSVSVSMDYGSQSEQAAWFSQTQPGASFWAATRSLRQASFIPGTSPRPRIWP
ncbi:MAG: DUF4054 domain-containing protein [Acetobacter sp.]|jgi:hypothetical protein